MLRRCDCNCNRVHSFFTANHSFDDRIVGKQEESEKKKSAQKWSKNFIRKALIGAPDVLKMLKTALINIQSFNQFLVLLMPSPSAPSAL